MRVQSLMIPRLDVTALMVYLRARPLLTIDRGRSIDGLL